MDLKLLNIDATLNYIEKIETLYHETFPIEERRDWQNIVDMITQGNGDYNVNVVVVDGMFAGFITWWRFATFRYIEHFAIEKVARGNGVGGAIIRNFVEMQPSNVVLEAELPSMGEKACRRIGFYERNGFIAQTDYEYMQPSYAADLPEVPLLLMVASNGNELESIEEIAKQIHRKVYKKG